MMNRFAVTITSCLQLLLALMCPWTVNSHVNKQSNGSVNAVYFANWGIYGRDFQPFDFPAQQVSHLLYAFANLRADGTVYSGDLYADVEKHYPGDSWNEPGNNAYGCIKQLFKLKQTYRNLKAIVSIGGWTWSTNFATVAATDHGRSRFAETAVGLMKDWGFDGIDVDWEYPSDDKDTKNMVLLLEAVRTELDNYAAEHSPGHHFELSIAAPAGPRNIGFLDIPRLNAVLDYFFIMAYDFAGSWSNMSGHQANLFHSESNPDATPFSIQEAVDAYLANGGTPSKLILGMPVYGRSFTSTDGPGLPYANVGEGDWEAGVWDYKSLPKPGAVITYDESASATLSYDSGTSVLISFDTPDMVKKKIAYIKDLGLGGSMFWEASADKSGAESLISTAVRNMGELKDGDNLLQYPVSQYDNIKNGLA